MSDTTDDEQLKPSVRVLQIIVIALAAGVSAFTIVALNSSGSKTEPNAISNLTMIGGVVAIIAVVMHVVIPQILIRGRIRHLIKADTVTDMHTELLGSKQVATIIACALLEGSAFINVSVYMTQRNMISIWISLGLTAMILTYFPTVNRLSNWLERKTREIEDQRQFTAQ